LDHCADAISPRDERLDEMRADESLGSGDGDYFVHLRFPQR
jgi:hypothetical protein